MRHNARQSDNNICFVSSTDLFAIDKVNLGSILYLFFLCRNLERYVHIHTYIQLYSNSLKSFGKGLVIICRLRAGTKDFWGDHTVFKGTEEGISPS